jgi:conjugal transfer pilus assembly protein TrbC
MKKFLLSALAIASIGTGGAVLAQTVEGLDLDAIRALSAKSEQDATALVNEVERRGDAFRKDAQTVQAVALEQMRTIDKASLPTGPAGAVDFDEMIQAASTNLKENQGTAPQFMVFVSTSMPEQALKDQQFASIGIDPRLFRAFDVTAVPTMVVSSSDFTPCDGLTCKTTPPPFDRIEGNVTVRYALETFAGKNGPGALVARTALANLGRNP